MTVAIPVLNGARLLPEVLGAIAGQHYDGDLEILVCDSGSTDDSVALARAAGARVMSVAAGTFHHADTRNRMVEQARGEFVAMLTQDATPASSDWLATLLKGFDAAPRVGLVYGPYRPRQDCPPLEAQRLRRFFDSLSPDHSERIDRLGPAEPRDAASIGPVRGYFTDANGCIRHSAWEHVRYPAVRYAEDHALAVGMLRGGWAKTYEPAAAVLHSHHYRPGQQLRRAFDDHRGLREIYDYRAPSRVGDWAIQMRGAVGVGVRGGGILDAVVDQSLTLLGAQLGSRCDRLPGWLRGRLSLEHRRDFTPLPGDGLVARAQRWM